jgi:hypothetical protein
MAAMIDSLIAAASGAGPSGSKVARIDPMARCNSPHRRSEVEPSRYASDWARAPCSEAPSAGKKVVSSESQTVCTARCNSAPNAVNPNRPIFRELQQSVLLEGDPMMVVCLRLENARGPKRVFRHELRIGPGGIEERSRERLVFCANRFQFVAAAQVIAGIEDPHVPICRGLGLRKIDEGSYERKIPNQFRGGAGPQPLSLPVAPMPHPINAAHRADDHNFGECPEPQPGVRQVAPIIPPQRQRQHCEQHGDRAQQVNRPETAPIAVAIVHGAGIKHEVGGSEGFDQWQQSLRRTCRSRRRRNMQPGADQEYSLDCLMQSHKVN